MPEWATLSIKRELMEEIRKLIEKNGRYRSISEFVAEAIRLRLEEKTRQGEVVRESPTGALSTPSERVTRVSTVSPEISESARGYINTQLQRLDQIWWVLVRLFGNLVRKDVNVDIEYARQLRISRTLINFIRSHICPECDIELANERLPELQHILENVKRDLIAIAICVSGDYAQKWINEIDRAERSELREIPTVGPRFVPGLPRDSSIGWMRITLTKSVTKEKVEEISRMLGVAVKSEDSLHFVVSGGKKLVKEAVEMLYQLQSK
jgi:Arc/MetJ-type ribon-helix-helix transcriptional regulator